MACCTSIWCERFPRPRSRGRFGSATARWSTPRLTTRQPDEKRPIREVVSRERPGHPGRFYLWARFTRAALPERALSGSEAPRKSWPALAQLALGRSALERWLSWPKQPLVLPVCLLVYLAARVSAREAPPERQRLWRQQTARRSLAEVK